MVLKFLWTNLKEATTCDVLKLKGCLVNLDIGHDTKIVVELAAMSMIKLNITIIISKKALYRI